MNRSCPRRRLALSLSDDVLEEIFARLPAKQVLRLRCLSRAWAARLSSDDFVEHHLRAASDGPKILCLRDSDDGSTAHAHASSLDGPGGAPFMGAPRSLTPGCFPHLASDVWPDEDDPHLYRRAPHLATQQCRGLVILHALQAGAFYVCNPSTGQMVTLPEGRTTCHPTTAQGSDSEASWYYASLGLGYDPRTGKHKVVRVHYQGSDDGEEAPRRAGCEVYEIGSSRCEWRPAAAGDQKPTCWVDQGSRSVFAQGHLYWLAHRKHYPPWMDCDQEDLVILSFSIADETLGTLPPPPGMGAVDSWTMWNVDLTELGGRLCVFCPYLDGVDHCDLWLLQSGLSGQAAKWDLHCRVDLGRASPELNNVTPFISLAPLAIIDNGRRILITEHSYPNQICAYTPATGHIESLVDTSNMSILHLAAGYMESVTSPGCQPSEDIVTITSPSTQALWVALRLLPKHTRGKLMCVCRSWRRMIERHSRIHPSV